MRKLFVLFFATFACWAFPDGSRDFMLDTITAEIALNVSKTITDEAFSLIFQETDRDGDGFVTLKEYYQSCAKVIERAWIEPEIEKREYRRFLARVFSLILNSSEHAKTYISFEN